MRPGARSLRRLGLACLLLAGVAGPALALAASAGDAAADGDAAMMPPELNPTGRDLVILAPLREHGPLGQVQMKISARNAISVSVDDLAAALGRLLRPEALAGLRAAATEGWISLPASARAGFPIRYDLSSNDLSIEIPLAARANQTLRLGRSIERQGARPDASAGLAAYLNYRVAESVAISGPAAGRAGVLADLQLAGRIDHVAFETEANIDQLAGQPFTRNETRLIYDIPGPAVRVTAGDLSTPTTAFQTDPQIAGLNVSHLLYGFNPNGTPGVQSGRGLLLTQPSSVEILINGVPFSQVRLGPGAYDLRDFPLAQGANSVQAVVTDAAGERRVVNFNFFTDASLLAPGTDEYTASLGVLGALGSDGPQYDGDQPLFSGFYRRGLSERVTAGFNLQASREGQVGGLDAVIGSPMGVVSVDVAASHCETGAFGGAARVLYHYAPATGAFGAGQTLDLSAEYRTPGFTESVTGASQAIGAGPLSGEAALFSAAFNRPLSQKLTLSLSASYTRSRLAGQDSSAASAFLTWRAPMNSTIGFGVTYLHTPRTVGPQLQGRGFSLGFTLSRRFGGHAMLNASADGFQQRADFTRSADRPIGDYALSGDVAHDASGYTGAFSGAWSTNRGAIELQYSNALAPDGALTQQQMSLGFDGAVAFAEGRFALGRRITDAFAIVAAAPSLGDRQVLVQSRQGDAVLAESGLFGPALVPLNAYRPLVLPYDVRNAPIGYDLGASAFDLYPWLHSGRLLTVGSAYFITAVGELLDADGAPLALRVGVATSLTDAKAPKAEVITNRGGRFAVSGLSAGRWRLTMPGRPSLAYELTIAAPGKVADGSLVRVGDLRPVATLADATGE